jgi:hypothetical protein
MGKIGKKASSPKPTKTKTNLVESVKTIADLYEGKLASSGGKVSVSDWIRLLTLHQQLAEENTRDITVRWVETMDEMESKD